MCGGSEGPAVALVLMNRQTPQHDLLIDTVIKADT